MFNFAAISLITLKFFALILLVHSLFVVLLIYRASHTDNERIAIIRYGKF